MKLCAPKPARTQSSITLCGILGRMIKIKYIIGIIILTILFSCGNSKNQSEKILKSNDLIQSQDSLQYHKSLSKQDSLKIVEYQKRQIWILKIKTAKFKPIFDKRLSIIGKFADTVRLDTLRESYISQLTNKETCNSYDVSYNNKDTKTTESFDDDYFIMDTLISLICDAKPRLMLKSKNSNLPILFLNDKDYCQITGISYLINVGDINSDNKDEIAVLCNSIRFAGVIETCRIFSCQDNKWIKLLSFEVYGPVFCGDDPKSKIKDVIPGFLVKKKGVWYYHDYHWQGFDSEMRPLKIK
jgi:hypothetical protein